MIHLLLALNFAALILETRGFYEKLNRRKRQRPRCGNITAF